MKFVELNEEQQEKAIEKHRQCNVDYDEWDDFLREDLQNAVKDYGFSDITIYADTSFCQGSGACFTCDPIDIEKYLRKTKQYSKYRKLHQLIKDNDLTGKIERTSIRYNHSNTIDSNLIVSYNIDITPEQDRLVGELQQDIIDYVRRECDEWHKVLENNYLNLTSDESVKETIIANEWDFEIADPEVTYL